MTNNSRAIGNASSTVSEQHSALRLADPPGQLAGGKDAKQTSLMHLSPRALERMAADPSMPPSVLKLLARHAEPAVRAAVSDNVSALPSIIWSLAMDRDPNVRYQLAENPHLPKEILHALSNDENPYVASRAERTISRISSL